MRALLVLAQFIVAVGNLIATLLCSFAGDYSRATYHLAWVVLMCIFLAVRALKEEER